ncbi:MAG: MBL fold metallo-hydrolase [Chromatiales bacterium]|nr:MBL fold metallo-hydrolase [Chromatiales bacterium]
MKVRFWGTRGSLPVSGGDRQIRKRLKETLKIASGKHFVDEQAIETFIDEQLPFPVRHGYGGNTSCVEIIGDDGRSVICDMGSGLRELGQAVLAHHGAGNSREYDFVMSHVHWDHIMGFPFFTPAYIPGNRIRVHGCHDIVETALRRQQSEPCFPVDFSQLSSEISFHRLQPGEPAEIAGMTVLPILQPHHGDSFGYRFEQNGKTVVYSTDAEHRLEDKRQIDAFVEFFRDADVVIFDAMYSLADMISVREDWGHSSNLIGVDLCHLAGVRHYCMFHHEPAYDDATIHRVLSETIRYEEISREGGQPLKVSSAYDGLIIEV